MLRFLDAGESHGKALVAILEGFPANFNVDLEYLNYELKRRQKGYGRGARMAIEEDKVEIWSGLRGGKTTGNPITLLVFNKDYENWREKIEAAPKEEEKITIPRPGHGDLVGYFKYNTGDIRDTIERTSARETAIRTAVGALCKNLLQELDIHVRSKVQNIGAISDDNVDLFDDTIYKVIEDSDLRCYNDKKEERIKDEIDICKKNGDTIGGSIFISMKNVPMGIGSYTHYDRKLDAILSFAIMSVQGIKAVEIGNGLQIELLGSQFNDQIFYEDGLIVRKTNNSGGIEAGISNGQCIDIKAYMKPIPTIRKAINSINLKDMSKVENRYERSDVCAVVPASIVLENVCAFELLKEILNTFPCDDFNQLKQNIKLHRNRFK